MHYCTEKQITNGTWLSLKSWTAKNGVNAVANALTPRHNEIEMLMLSQAPAIADHAHA